MIWILCFLLMAFKPIHQIYDTPDKINEEFQNVEDDLQSQQYRVFSSTPNLSELKDGQIVIFSSGAIKIMFRQNNDIYSVNASCITIRR